VGAAGARHPRAGHHRPRAQQTKKDKPAAVLLTTELDATPAQTIERYADRWPIEVSFQQAKQLFGVGDARNRTTKAVERTVPFQFLAMSLTITWYALHGHHPDVVSEHHQRAPWYQTKTTPSFADMLAKLRRVIPATQYHPGTHQQPTPREINQVQQAWAATGLKPRNSRHVQPRLAAHAPPGPYGRIPRCFRNR
jgi:uncharacterized iron-regulated membrane protein